MLDSVLVPWVTSACTVVQWQGCDEVQSVRSVRVQSVPVLARMQYQYKQMVGQGRPEQLYLKQQ